MATPIPVLAVRDAVHFPGLINTLHVVREPSVRALRRANKSDRTVLILSQRDMSQDEPKADNLYSIGTLSEALQTIPLPDTSLRVALRGIRRVRVRKIIERGGGFLAECEDLVEIPASGLAAEALGRTLVETFTRIVELNKDIPPESLEGVIHAVDLGLLADTVLHHLPGRTAEKQALLEELDQTMRLERALQLLKGELQILQLSRTIHERVERELGDTQREYYLREQLRTIQLELQQREDRIGESDEYRARIVAAKMPPNAEAKALEEVRRLDRSPAHAPEGMVLRTYLDTLCGLPWSQTTEDRLDVKEAERLLDERHYGLGAVKDRILEHLAVCQLRGSAGGAILCFSGPPGVGKTSLGKSIADALGRKLVRIALGGIRDEAEIRGHRRAYVGAMPGRVIQGLAEVGSRNPVIVLDEIDKLAHGTSGDPTSALLEALDPEQNSRFSDHFVEIPFDLSDAFFIATANIVENIPRPLRDRMEIIQFSGYTEAERTEIGRRYLFPKALLNAGLPETVALEEDALRTIIREYAPEAGVRELNRRLNALCRKVARATAGGSPVPDRIQQDDLAGMLGKPRMGVRPNEAADLPGVAWGLVVSEAGGGIIAIEASIQKYGSEPPVLRITGNLGDVMRESALAALTVLQASQSEPLKRDIHIHVPEGAIPKDGPSAGIAILAALSSALAGRPLRTGFAMTGEVTLRGRVLAIGGLRDKVLAAISMGMTDVILPSDNAPDLDELPEAAKAAINLHLVSTADEALALLFP